MITTSIMSYMCHQTLNKKKIKKRKREVVAKKKTWYSSICPICANQNRGRSLLRVEHKPKRIEEAHSETRKLHCDLDSTR